MRNIPETFVITKPVTWHFRDAQFVDKALSQGIHQLCERNNNVLTCFLLEARQNADTDTKLVIAMLLENEAIYLRQIAAQFQDALSAFPHIASQTAIMSGVSFKDQFAGKEFYIQQNQT